MSKPIIFCDLDGVIYDFIKAYFDEMVWYYGWDESKWNEYSENPDKYINTPLGKQLLKVPVMYTRCNIEQSERKALYSLSKAYDIWYVTARSEQVKCATVNWLRRERLPEGNLVMTNEKGDLAKEVKPLFAVDDQVKYIEMLAPFTQVFIRNRPWNALYKHTYRINSLQDLVVA